jgi:hypothetical protein
MLIPFLAGYVQTVLTFQRAQTHRDLRKIRALNLEVALVSIGGVG